MPCQTPRGTHPGGRSTAASRLQRWAAEVLALLVLFVLLHLWTTRHVAQGVAPDLRGTLLDGGDFELRSRAAGPVLVYFWASWCPICRLSEGAVDAISRDWQVVGIAMQSGGAEDVKAFMRAQGIAFPVLVDQDGSIAARWGVTGVPTSFVVGADGSIRFVETGYTSGPGLRLRLQLAGL